MVIIGHSYALPYFPHGMFDYFYSFHVSCFFILSFSYPAKQLSIERVKNNVVRLLVPYLLLYALFSAIVVFLNTNNIYVKQALPYGDYSFIGFLWTFITGGFLPLQVYTGMQYLWFMPAMFSFMVIKDYFKTQASSRLKAFILCIGAFCYFFAYVYEYYPPYPNRYVYFIQWMSPLSILHSLGMVFISVLTMFCLRIRLKYIMGGAFVLCTIWFWIGIYAKDVPFEDIIRICRLFMPLPAFCFFYSVKGVLARIKLLRAFGNKSMIIYLVQSPICVLICSIQNKLSIISSPIGTLVSLLIIISASYLVTMAIMRFPTTKFLFASRTYIEFENYFFHKS